MPARMILSLCALACATCCLHRPPPILVEVPAGPCLHEAPPQRVDVHVSGPEEGCPEKFAACFLPEDGAALGRRLQGLERWADDAWLRCGERPSSPEDKKREAPPP